MSLAIIGVLKNLFSVSADGSDTIEFLLRCAIAVLLGFFIGFERQWTRHPGGIITNVLICVGAFLFTGFSFVFAKGEDIAGIRDFTRVAAQVVAGIGFLGAGVIMRQGLNIKGLNTAATMWCAGAIGVLCAHGSIWRPVIGTAAILLVNILFRPVAHKVREKRFKDLKNNEDDKVYVIRISCNQENEYHVRALFMQMVAAESIILRDIVSTDADDDRVKIKATIVSESNQETEIEKIISRISVEEGVLSAGWKDVLKES